jgi:hypothetical protein
VAAALQVVTRNPLASSTPGAYRAAASLAEGRETRLITGILELGQVSARSTYSAEWTAASTSIQVLPVDRELPARASGGLGLGPGRCHHHDARPATVGRPSRPPAEKHDPVTRTLSLLNAVLSNLAAGEVQRHLCRRGLHAHKHVLRALVRKAGAMNERGAERRAVVIHDRCSRCTGTSMAGDGSGGRRALGGSKATGPSALFGVRILLLPTPCPRSTPVSRPHIKSESTPVVSPL